MSSSEPGASPPHPPITLRSPTTTLSGGSRSNDTAPPFTPPAVPWLLGTWHVTHSTLPMWKSARNVTITYAARGGSSSSSSSPADELELLDLVTYQPLSGRPRRKTVRGTDRPTGPGAWRWRGSGWLAVASSRWEVLGYGEGAAPGEQWVVTFFARTLFTPAGIDVYSRRKEGLAAGTLEALREALGRVEADVVRDLARNLFEVKSD